MTQSWSQDHYLAAIRFAAEAHNDQTITGTNLPYLLHLNLVAMEVLAALAAEPSHDGELAIGCALLHDVIEDTSVTHTQVADLFGIAIANGVLALTKDASLPKDQQMADSLKRIQQQPSAVWLVKLADRICNMQPPPKHWSVSKIEHYRDEAQLILATLGSASQLLAERLGSKIRSYPVL